MIAPGNQVVDILHDHGLLISRRAHARDQMRFERGIFPGVDGRLQVSIRRQVSVGLQRVSLRSHLRQQSLRRLSRRLR